MKFIALLFFFTAHALSIEPMDNYYADDLLDAVDQAKSSPHHYDYSNHYRYKRTTAQSIELNRLNLRELDATRLKTKERNHGTSTELELELADDVSIDTAQANPSLGNKGNQEVNIQIFSTSNSTQYRSNQMQLNSKGIIDNSSIRSTTRP